MKASHFTLSQKSNNQTILPPLDQTQDL